MVLCEIMCIGNEFCSEHNHFSKCVTLSHLIRVLPLDLVDPVATRAATEKARKLFGKIDILFNNAGDKCIRYIPIHQCAMTQFT